MGDHDTGYPRQVRPELLARVPALVGIRVLGPGTECVLLGRHPRELVVGERPSCIRAKLTQLQLLSLVMLLERLLLLKERSEQIELMSAQPA